MARPTDYTEELADRICEEILNNTYGIHTICKDEGMPHPSTVFRWINQYVEFYDKYARAREIQAELLADEIISIADDAQKDLQSDGKIDHDHIQRSKLRVDARKWKSSKLHPKRFGDKLDVTTKGEQINSKTTGITLPDGTIIEI